MCEAVAQYGQESFKKVSGRNVIAASLLSKFAAQFVCVPGKFDVRFTLESR